MSPVILLGRNVIIQGITGKSGSLHARLMRDYGTNIVAGTSPTKAGETIDSVPVYATIRDIKQDFSVDTTIIFVPAKFAKSAIFEAIDEKIPLIIAITEHIPVHDMLQIQQHIAGKPSTLIGPNCPGILIPGVHNLGITPAALSTPGDTAVVSRSGTLTYEAMDALTNAGFGQRYIIGIGGDALPGTSFVDCLELFERDDSVKRIVLIGEIGGTAEIEAADYIKTNVTKPVYAYVAGHFAPQGVRLGHAGAILGTNALESAQAKTTRLADCGATVADSITELVDTLRATAHTS